MENVTLYCKWQVIKNVSYHFALYFWGGVRWRPATFLVLSSWSHHSQLAKVREETQQLQNHRHLHLLWNVAEFTLTSSVPVGSNCYGVRWRWMQMQCPHWWLVGSLVPTLQCISIQLYLFLARYMASLLSTAQHGGKRIYILRQYLFLANPNRSSKTTSHATLHVPGSCAIHPTFLLYRHSKYVSLQRDLTQIQTKD